MILPRKTGRKLKLETIIFDYVLGTLFSLFLITCGCYGVITMYMERKWLLTALSLLALFAGIRLFSMLLTSMIANPSGSEYYEMDKKKSRRLEKFLWITAALIIAVGMLTAHP